MWVYSEVNLTEVSGYKDYSSEVINGNMLVQDRLKEEGEVVSQESY